MAKENKRNASINPPYMMLITPAGDFYRSPLATNIRDGRVHVVDGEADIRPKAKKKGYLTLEDGCDNADQLKYMTAFFELEDREGDQGPIPDKHLPNVVVSRRKASNRKAALDFDRFVKEVKAG